MKKILIIFMITATVILGGCSKPATTEKLATNQQVQEYIQSHDEITIKLELEEGYSPISDCKALIEVLKQEDNKQAELIIKSLEKLIEGNKEESEELYFEALFYNGNNK